MARSRYYLLQEFVPRRGRKTVATFSTLTRALQAAKRTGPYKRDRVLHPWEIITGPRPRLGSAIVAGTTRRARKLEAEGAFFGGPNHAERLLGNPEAGSGLKGTEAERQFLASQAAYFHSLTYDQQMELERRDARVFNGGLLLGGIGGAVLGGVGVAIVAALSKD